MSPPHTHACMHACMHAHVQVCSSAHPRWMRNLLDEPRVPLADQRSSNDSSCTVQLLVDCVESALVLPVIDDPEE